MKKSPYNIIQIEADLYAIQEETTRCFLLVGGDAALLIDTGTGVGNIRKEVEKLTDLPIIVANTHSDFDHIGGNKQFERAYVHVSEFDRYRSVERANGEFDDDVTTLVPMWESDFIDIGGGMLEVILLPGHTPGNVAFIERNNGLLFVGDLMLSEQIFMFNNQTHKGRNMEAYVYSLEKLLCMKDEFETVYCAHYDLTFPVDKLEELAKGARKVLEGEITGKKPDKNSPYKVYDIGVTKILY
jgi:glyoxylase-like metal-dependent hydrolase (beta-lactamase superfamily II)